MEVRLTVNGESRSADVAPNSQLMQLVKLVQLLRESRRLTTP